MLHAYGLKFAINNSKFDFISEIPNHFISFIKKNNFIITKNYKKKLDIF